MKFQLLFVFMLHFLNANSARILGIIPTPSYSHQVVFQSLWKELSLRGHQVIVLTTDPVNDPSLKNLTEINLNFSYKTFQNIIAEMKVGFLTGVRKYFKGMIDIIEEQIQHPQVQEIINNDSEKFDIMLIEYMHPMMLGFSKKFNCPTIGIMSVEVSMASIHTIMGSPTHPVLYPDLGVSLPFTGEMDFFHRVYSTLFSLFMPILLGSSFQEMEESTRKIFNFKDFDMLDTLTDIDLLFTNSNPILYPVRPLPPAIIEIGGGLQLKPPKPLPQDLQKYLDDAKEGFIYFSLGTNAKSKDLPKKLLNTFLQTFSKLPYKILWKYENDKLEGKPENVMIRKWLPQQDVLRHPNIKLFIFQCGSQSTEEALYSKVPVLGIPMIGDQDYNARLITTKGWGLALDSNTLTPKIFESTIFELIQNPKYRNKVIELENLVKDQPMTALEKAVWWTEYVIRHKGAKHLRSPVRDIPSYQYYMLDVISFYLIVVVMLIFGAIWSVKITFKVLRYLGRRVKAKSD